MAAPRHIFQTYIRATPEAVWQAITDPEFTRRYFHRTAIESTFTPGAPGPLRAAGRAPTPWPARSRRSSRAGGS